MFKVNATRISGLCFSRYEVPLQAVYFFRHVVLSKNLCKNLSPSVLGHDLSYAKYGDLHVLAPLKGSGKNSTGSKPRCVEEALGSPLHPCCSCVVKELPCLERRAINATGTIAKGFAINGNYWAT